MKDLANEFVRLPNSSDQAAGYITSDRALASDLKPPLEVRALTKSFGQHEVLRGISLAARTHDVISIIGASGSGKSTLLRCVNFLEHPSGGEIVVAGETVQTRMHGGELIPSDHRQITRIRASLAMVFQQFNLWSHLTVLENVIEAPVHVQGRPRKECVDEATALLERVGLADRSTYYPAHLSGGQQQRCAIARALAMRPRVMLFDEPTSALDPELVGEVLKVMRGLASEGRTMLIVTHEMQFAREVSTRTIFLHNGLVEEDGPPDQVFVRPQSDRCAKFLSAHMNK